MPVNRTDFNSLGATEFFEHPQATILNSRQSKYPIGSDRWIEMTVEAVKYATHSGYTIISSVGMNTWETVTTLASREEGNIIIVAPETGGDRESEFADICREFNLNPSKSAVVFLESDGNKKQWPKTRDEFIARQADIIIPVAVRPDGNLDRLLGRYPNKATSEFRTEYKRPSRPRPRYDNIEVNPLLFKDEYIVHFTRSQNGPRPGETKYDFYSDVITSRNHYCRSARNILRHILETGRLAASDRGIRDGRRVVGFSAVTYADLKQLFRYRPRLVNPYFEPYGVAIRKKTAEAIGIRPVIYGTPDVYSLLKEEDRPYFQNAGSRDMQWLPEQEWRHVGDLDLGNIPTEELAVIVGFPEEIELFYSTTRSKIITYSK